jgi:hypothetical protein
MVMTTVMMGVLGGVGLVQIYFLARLRRACLDIGRVHDRVARLDAAVNVLTDTCDCGFRSIAEEIGRTAAGVNRPAPKRSASRRVRTAARNGSSVAAIAAAEEMSEGEVRLRLQLPVRAQAAAADHAGKPAARQPRTTKERKGRGSLRAS